MRAAVIPASFKTIIMSLTIFILTFFISQMLSKYNTRFENVSCSPNYEHSLQLTWVETKPCQVCKTNGYVTRLTAQAAALYPKPEAEALMRYTNAILHIYYYLMSEGGMSQDKWQQMMDRGILTLEEVEGLKRQGSPGVVIYSWAVDILKTRPKESAGSALELEQSLNQVNM
jgi:hypothetical protein